MEKLYTTFFYSLITTTILSYAAFLTRNIPIISGFFTAFPNKNLVYSITAYFHLKDKESIEYIKNTLDRSSWWFIFWFVVIRIILLYI